MKPGQRGTWKRVVIALAVVVLIAAGLLWLVTRQAMVPVDARLRAIGTEAQRVQVLDRYGTVLNATYSNQWNLFEQVPLREVPPALVNTVLQAEDRRFFAHSGPDWRARCRAALQNLAAGRVVSGASTITEQVVRMLHPRPRSIWSRWLEGWEARVLEQTVGKPDILTFYLNQVPYAAQRRGVVQAARYYFDRDLDTLNQQEMLALAVLVRAPSRLDLFSGDRTGLLEGIERLVRRIPGNGLEGADNSAIATAGAFKLRKPTLPLYAGHFLRFVTDSQRQPLSAIGRVNTTLDGPLQRQLGSLLDQRLRSLKGLQVHNAALLVADHRSGEILAWVVGGENDPSVPGRAIDAVLSRRQPGSTLKPFLYALALERGWTAATLIDDRPLVVALGGGQHDYHNYSRRFHGPVTLREALGNSLNIPAIKTLRYTGVATYHSELRRLGFTSLAQTPDHYGDGLALGSGEVSLFELVQAFGALANRGVLVPLRASPAQSGVGSPRRIYSEPVASLVGNILSDAGARALEFGRGSLLNFPVQTAVKTGTSSDYRDSWAVGYNESVVAGVWMGNLDQLPTLGVTGSIGPALVLRAVIDQLGRDRQTRPMWLSPELTARRVCADSGQLVDGSSGCRTRIEYFHSRTVPQRSTKEAAPEVSGGEPDISLLSPSPGLQLAVDPRLSPELQAYEFVLEGVRLADEVHWRIDDVQIKARGGRYLWPLQRGSHVVSAEVWRQGTLLAQLDGISFRVR